MKTKIIIGILFIGILLLLVPTISAVNYTTVKKTYQEKIERTLEEYNLLLKLLGNLPPGTSS